MVDFSAHAVVAETRARSPVASSQFGRYMRLKCELALRGDHGVPPNVLRSVIQVSSRPGARGIA